MNKKKCQNRKNKGVRFKNNAIYFLLSLIRLVSNECVEVAKGFVSTKAKISVLSLVGGLGSIAEERQNGL
jgi:hypothetical protein